MQSKTVFYVKHSIVITLRKGDVSAFNTDAKMIDTFKESIVLL